MSLNLYRRHQGKCEAGHSLDKRTSEFEERKKGWKKCGCYIFASGALAGKYRRKYTGSADWAEAKIVAAEWEKAGQWDGEIPAPVVYKYSNCLNHWWNAIGYPLTIRADER